MLGTECHNFNEGRFVMFVVIKFEFLPCNQCEPCANSFFVLGDKTVNCLLNARKEMYSVPGGPCNKCPTP